MRKVGVSDGHLEGQIAACQAHLDRCLAECENLASSRGMVEALQGFAARGVAQYGLVVERLSAARESGCVQALRDASLRTVDDIREGVDEWRMLANATILEVLAKCVEVEL
jgi:hypothetical protein